MNYKKRYKTEFIAVHCSATSEKMNIGKEDIDRWHRAKGWFGIGYHYVIRRDGTVEEGRPHDVAGAHVQGYNSQSVGICMVGGVNSSDTKAANNFTPEQFESLKDVLKTLKGFYPEAKIQGHRDFPDVHKDCPSFDVAAWLKAEGIDNN